MEFNSVFKGLNNGGFLWSKLIIPFMYVFELYLVTHLTTALQIRTAQKKKAWWKFPPPNFDKIADTVKHKTRNSLQRSYVNSLSMWFSVAENRKLVPSCSEKVLCLFKEKISVQKFMNSWHWGSHISRQSAHEGGKVVSPTHRPPLPRRKYSWYSFLLDAESTGRNFTIFSESIHQHVNVTK